MKAINKTAARVMQRLVVGLGVGEARRFEEGKAFMGVSVDRIDDALFAVAHRYEQNGDLVPDPEVVFWRADDGEFYPVSYEDGFGYRVAIELENGTPKGVRPREQADLAKFANTWMRNIRDQQQLRFEVRESTTRGVK